MKREHGQNGAPTTAEWHAGLCTHHRSCVTVRPALSRHQPFHSMANPTWITAEHPYETGHPPDGVDTVGRHDSAAQALPVGAENAPGIIRVHRALPRDRRGQPKPTLPR